MRRVLVVGASGAGKSTLARNVAESLKVPHVELDALYHGPGWVPRPAFRADVDEITGAPGWIVDGNYAAVRELLWARADTVVWLDLPRWLVEWQVVTRTARRIVCRTTLWNGNRERWRELPRASHPIRWGWRKHGEYRTRYGARFADPLNGGKELVRLRSRREVRRWVAALPPAPLDRTAR
ncbi:adenylate kinase [Frankia sp. Mgl5]|uniref:adenylate kinase n=1 Tax=Frankia sp. Mgl5 TaxID=2933793 RepID=UPI00200CD31C|nr:adenylate kinase [Frankia sp. Mgl5]MCK9926938.1 adenylate kinase [Frankia sp. Mgl5]